VAKIDFKILRYDRRRWWRRKYDVRMEAKGFMTPDTAWIGSFWTVKGARKFVDRKAAKYDFKTVEAATMEHTEDEI
jgi:hypothetical protein